MDNLAIIPARSGSKGLKDKNIKLLNGKPLLWYAIDAAVKSKCFDEIMVSTDSESYASIAEDCGAKVPFLRNIETSGDKASSWDTVREVLDKYSEKGIVFNTVCLLQPTSPLRTSEDIVGAYKLMESKKCDAVTSVCEVQHSPIWCMKLDETSSLKEFRKSIVGVGNRQTLDKFYMLNGAIYIRKVDYEGGRSNLIDNDEYAYIMSQDNSVDIDTMLDFVLAETMIKERTI